MRDLETCPVHIAKRMVVTPANNILYYLLSFKEYQELISHLECVSLPLGTIIHRESEPIDYVYFPNHAMISLVATMENGSTTEISLVGKEGMVGLPVILGGRSITHEAVVQVSGTAMRIKSEIIKEQFERFPQLRKIILLYVQIRLSYISQLAACNRQHKIETRLARWLLLVQDCLKTEQLPLTQEFIANMLGTNRAGVTVAAQKLQKQGIINYTRGSITVEDREQLEKVSCECYQVMRNEFHRLFTELDKPD